MVRAASMFSMPVPLSRTMTSTRSPCSSSTISTRPRIPWARKLEIGLSISSQRVWPKSLKLPEMPAKNSLPLGALSMFRMMILRIIVPPKNVFSKTKRTVQVIALHRAGGSYNIPLAPLAEKGYTVPIGAGNPVV